MLKILSYIEPCQVVADVGCDHGKLGIELLLHNYCANCIFSDISEPSLNKATNLSLEKQVYSKCQFIVSNGFEKFSSETKIDYAIIAGMGGREIVNILLNRPKELDIKKFVLQPNNNVVYLRRMLVQNGFKIILDEVVLDNGIFYNVLLVKYGKDLLLKNELEFGRTNLIKLNPDFVKYLEFKLNQLALILNDVKGTTKEAEISALIEDIKNVLKGKRINATRNR